jgi:hypothetical protein
MQHETIEPWFAGVLFLTIVVIAIVQDIWIKTRKEK